jgi:hypothetical protein
VIFSGGPVAVVSTGPLLSVRANIPGIANNISATTWDRRVVLGRGNFF